MVCAHWLTLRLRADMNSRTFRCKPLLLAWREWAVIGNRRNGAITAHSYAPTQELLPLCAEAPTSARCDTPQASA